MFGGVTQTPIIQRKNVCISVVQYFTISSVGNILRLHCPTHISNSGLASDREQADTT